VPNGQDQISTSTRRDALGKLPTHSTENAIPNHKANGNRNSKKRGRAPWNEEIGQASRRTKQTFHRWRIDGSPKEPRNALYKEMKESKKTLRQKLRQAAARIRENKYNDIIESADFNQQLFYKLIREQRTTRSDETDTIIIDDMVPSEDECILNGWNTHFQRLSTPDPGIENTEDPSAMECTLILHRRNIERSKKEGRDPRYHNYNN